MGTKEILMKFANYFSRSNFLFDGIQGLGWAILKGLSWLVLQVEKGVDSFYSLLDITTKFGLESFFSKVDLKMIFIACVTLTLMYLGVRMLLGHEDIKVTKIPQNILLFLVVMLAIPTVFMSMNKLTLAVRDAVGAGGDQLTNAMMVDYLTDLKYLDSKDWKFSVSDGRIKTDTTKNYIGSSSKDEKGKREWLESINITERFDAESEEYKTKELFQSELIYDDSNVATVEKFEQIRIDLFGLDFTSYYYRYQFDFLPCLVSLLCTGAALIFVCYKIIRISVDIVAHKILLPFFAATGFSDNQKTVHILKGIFWQYAALMMTAVMLKFFYLVQAYISSSISNVVLQIIAMIVVTVAVIDGPNIFERVTGVDAGIKSGFQTMLGAYHAGKAVGGAAKGVGAAAAALGGGIGNMTTRLAGAAGSSSGMVNNLMQREGSSNSDLHESSSNQQSHTAQGGDQQNSNLRSSSPTSNMSQNPSSSNARHLSQQDGRHTSNSEIRADQNRVDMREQSTADSGRDAPRTHEQNTHEQLHMNGGASTTGADGSTVYTGQGTEAGGSGFSGADQSSAFGDGEDHSRFPRDLGGKDQPGTPLGDDDHSRFPQEFTAGRVDGGADGRHDLPHMDSSESINFPDPNDGWNGRSIPDMEEQRSGRRAADSSHGAERGGSPGATFGNYVMPNQGERNLRDSAQLNRDMGDLRTKHGKLSETQHRNYTGAANKSLPSRMRDSYQAGRQLQDVKREMRTVKSEQKALKRAEKQQKKGW